MDKEKEIEEMETEIFREIAKTVLNAAFETKEKNEHCSMQDILSHISYCIYKERYRKEDEVCNETTKEIWDCFKGYKKEFRIIEWGMIKRIFQEYGVEVNE